MRRTLAEIEYRVEVLHFYFSSFVGVFLDECGGFMGKRILDTCTVT
jgi:hypothetical protein